MNDPERELQDSLRRHAQDAPRADLIAERIIARAESGSHARSPWTARWRTWALPVLASASVAAVVVGVAVGGAFDHEAGKSPTGHDGSGSSSPSSPEPSPSTSVAPTPVDVGLHHFRVVDLTFASSTHGWALGTADCVRGGGTCSAIVSTVDGSTWSARGGRFGTPFHVGTAGSGCADPCVQHLRFATDDVGYAFGPSALFLTTDGGRNWVEQDGGALALETLSGNVIRVTGTDGGCPGPCDVRVETASVGSSTWTDSNLAPQSGASVAFSRGDSDAYLLVKRNPAGGANNATSTLFRSQDEGRTWQAAGEPCPQVGPGSPPEVDSTAVSAAPAGRVSVLCRDRWNQRSFVATSSDHGAHFAAQDGTIPAGAASDQLVGDPDSVLVSADTRLVRSTDGGRTWHAAGLTDGVSFVGFESDSVGRAVRADGAVIWTTTDAGATWTAFTFP
jgi:photosystem II stability/assembly factor-like uncharacterized protein